MNNCFFFIISNKHSIRKCYAFCTICLVLESLGQNIIELIKYFLYSSGREPDPRRVGVGQGFWDGLSINPVMKAFPRDLISFNTGQFKGHPKNRHPQKNNKYQSGKSLVTFHML